jgi:RNA polymerase sigma factor (sigma-70 family)
MHPPQQGDEGQLFQSFNDELLQRVRRLVRGASQANIEDACAVAWVQFLRYQPDRQRNWRGWLLTVARREALGLHVGERSIRHLGFAEPADHDRVPEPADPRPSPQLTHLEFKEALGVLDHVPERQREAARLRLVGLKYKEIAGVLGVSYGRVDKLLAAADAHIHEQLIARQQVGSGPPRLQRLQALERESPLWLTRVIGRPPDVTRGSRLLAWRRAALALDDYRSAVGRSRFEEGLGSPARSEDESRRRSVVLRAMERLDAARATGRDRTLER